MRLCTIAQTEIRVSAAVWLLLLFAAATEALSALLCSLWALALHEMCHALAASALGYACESFELLPFGATLKLRGTAEPSAMIAIALAGPVGSLVAAMACTLGMHFLPDLRAMLEPLLRVNMLLALFNLLPAQPLDGGRIFTALLQRVISGKKAAAVGAMLGAMLGATLIGAGIWLWITAAPNPTLLASGGLLLANALREWRARPLARLGAAYGKGVRLHKAGSMRTRVLAVSADTPAREAQALLSPYGYHLLLVVDERMNLLGRLGEGELTEAMLRCGEDVPLGKII